MIPSDCEPCDPWRSESELVYWFDAKQGAFNSRSFSADKGVCVTVCLSAWIRPKNDLIQLLKTTFSLATYESNRNVMDYFSCPQCEWDECLQRRLHNKGSLFLWVDVRPSQQDVLCETDRLALSQSLWFAEARSLIKSQNWLGGSAMGHQSFHLFTEGNLSISKSACVFTCWPVSFPYLSACTSISWPVCTMCVSERDRNPPRLLVFCHLQPIKD